MNYCSKCNSISSVILRKRDLYCNECFLSGTNHKFRACIGKNKILSKNDKVLLCTSGGPGSTVMLDLVKHGLSLDIHKKLRILPFILHVIGSSDKTVAPSLLKLCRLYNYDIYFVHIFNYIAPNKLSLDVNNIPEDDHESSEKFQSILKSMPATACNDFIKKVKRSLFIRCAELLQCRYIFTAETTTSLAINLLSNITIGRGSQVQNDVGFIDACDKNVKILRPMKDISQEELDYYIKIKELNPKTSKDLRNNSLQTVISTFVTELQDNFQSTISTVCKTADKIGITSEGAANRSSCSICENPFTERSLKLSAMDATNFSRTASFGKPLHDNINETMFPYIDEKLCYSCSRNYSEMKCGYLTSILNLPTNNVHCDTE